MFAVVYSIQCVPGLPFKDKADKYGFSDKNIQI